MEMSPKEALRLAIATLEAGNGLNTTMVQDREAAATLARLAPFVEAAMHHAALQADSYDELARECRAEFYSTYRALVGAPAPTEGK
jgi:hypothetical protein